MGSRSLHGRRWMATWVTSACGDVHDHASPYTWLWSTPDFWRELRLEDVTSPSPHTL